MQNPQRKFQKKSSHELTAIIAYLMGVPKWNFKTDDPDKLNIEVYEEINKNKNARIIRNLCTVRTYLEKNLTQVKKRFKFEGKNINTIPDLMPIEAVSELYKDGVDIYNSRPSVDKYAVILNREISNRINTCEKLFPEWVEWKYIRPLFVAPNGMDESTVQRAFQFYRSNRRLYPFACYFNWPGDYDGTNLLGNDKQFLKKLYEAHKDIFTNWSLVSDANEITKDNIKIFLQQSEKALVVVDCENSDPVKLAAVLSSIKTEDLSKIYKVLLFSSDYTTTQWETLYSASREQNEVTSPWNALRKLASFELEYINVERLLEHKSQVDMTLAARACKEVYKNDVDSIVLVSSDSDYWALINQLPETDFIVMLEKEKTSPAIKEALCSREIHFCYIDDFCQGASYAVKTSAIKEKLHGQINAIPLFNAKDMLANALKETWITMTPKEEQAFFDRYLKTLQLKVAPNGEVSIVFSES